MKTEMCNRVFELKNRPCIISGASAVGKTEANGPIGKYFDIRYENDGMNEETWEKAESKMLKDALLCAVEKAEIKIDDIDVLFAGDLLNQCTSSSYAIRNLNVPFCGLFGACSTMALSLLSASIFVDSGYVDIAAAATSSHFCSAEKQFRYPLEYGGQKAPPSQRTVTGAGAFVIGKNVDKKIRISRVLIGKVVDLGITDAANMGAAMAPAAAESVSEFLLQTKTEPNDYDLILTGDLGKVGTQLFLELIYEKYKFDASRVHNDCGLIIYDLNDKNINSGGSGCGCSATVLASYITKKMYSGEYKRVLFAATGALMSPTLSLQGESIPGISHIVELVMDGE